MESFFFNITDTRYKVTELFKEGELHMRRVDISNGVVFFDVVLDADEHRDFQIKNLDRMIMLTVVKKGILQIDDQIAQKSHLPKEGAISIYGSSRQKLIFTTGGSERSEVFILFIADFFLKRYLSSKRDEPIDFLYNMIQDELSLELVDTQPIDALSLYIIDKIVDARSNSSMKSIRCEHSVIEFLIHKLSFCDMIDEGLDDDERSISKRAKDVLLENFVYPPTIHDLAHLCATNESKLKKVFKRVYKSTIYNYIQRLRLEEANLLLKEQTLSIGEISKRVGYRHQGHFSKLFFTTYGVYPKDLLKR